MKAIYTADPWKLFLIIMCPVLFPSDFIGTLLRLLFMAALLTWAYFLTTELYKKLPGGHPLSLNNFKLHFFFPLIYFTLAIGLTGGYSINNSNFNQYGAMVYFIIVLHLISMYCIFYCLYFMARTLITVETQHKNIRTSDYIGYIFGFWFLPVGIWFIQPKIKRLFTNG